MMYATHTETRFGVLDPAISDARNWFHANLPFEQARQWCDRCQGMPPDFWRAQVALVMQAQGANAARHQRAVARRQAQQTPAELLGVNSRLEFLDAPMSSCAAGEADPAGTPLHAAEDLDADDAAASGRDGQESNEEENDAQSILLVDTNPVAPSDDPTTDTIEQRCERYTKLRLQTLQQAEYIATIDPTSEQASGRDTPDIADNLRRCGSYLVFRRYDCIDENRLQAGMFCQRGRLCAFCSMRRMVRAVQRFVPMVYQAIVETETTACLWTPTIRNGPDLLERLELFRDSDKKLNQRGRNYRNYIVNPARRRKQRYTEWHKVIGQLWAIEIKKGSGSGLWHPHQHSVILCTDTLDQDALSAEWHELTNGSHRVDVRELYAMQDIRNGASYDEVRDQLTQDLLEVISYALKFSTMSPAETWEAFIACHHFNLMGRRGCLHGIKVADEYLDAPLELEDLPYVETVARWVDDHYDIEHADTWEPMNGGAA